MRGGGGGVHKAITVELRGRALNGAQRLIHIRGGGGRPVGCSQTGEEGGIMTRII